MSAFAGGCVVVSIVVVPGWREMDPEEFLDWFSKNGPRLGATMFSLEAAGALSAVLAFVGTLRRGSEGRLLWGMSSLCIIATLGLLPMYFAQANMRMLNKDIEASEVGAEIERWASWQWLRTALAVLAVVFGGWGAPGAGRVTQRPDVDLIDPKEGMAMVHLSSANQCPERLANPPRSSTSGDSVRTGTSAHRLLQEEPQLLWRAAGGPAGARRGAQIAPASPSRQGRELRLTGGSKNWMAKRALPSQNRLEEQPTSCAQNLETARSEDGKR